MSREEDAEPQNFMPVGDSLANGCLFRAKNFNSREDLPLSLCIAARGKTRQR